MQNHMLAKLLGWLQFGTTTATQLFSNGVPHSWQSWFQLVTSAIVAVGIHTASSTDGTK